ncbi:MAG: WecB/TagA/CpsF family glycosyltransferase [Hyphomicrobiaceae bacterium]
MRDQFRLQLGDVNVSKLVDMQSDPELRRCTEESDVVCVDGMGVLWGSRLLGVPVKERVAGIDLMSELIRVCAQEGFRPYFLGAKQSVVEDLVARLKRQYPKLAVAGYRNGYFKPEDEAEVVADIKASGADCLFVGISSPIKERFLNRYRDELSVPVQMGVGGSFDVLSGHIRRAPVLVQMIGLEWLFRLLQEPRRLARRYYVSNSIFFMLLLRTILAGERGGSPLKG